MSIKLPFLTKDDKFFDLFEEGAANLVETAKVLRDLVDRWENVDEKVRQITDLEHKGDDITHRIMANLHSTFLTPIDREDISALAHALDDVVDFIHSAADNMVIYKVKRPTKDAVELANVIVDAALEVQRAMPGLRRRAELGQVLSRCVELNRLENEGDRIMRRAVGSLFENNIDLVEVIKWREIYEHMETATDRCEDVANVLEGVALKNA